MKIITSEKDIVKNIQISVNSTSEASVVFTPDSFGRFQQKIEYLIRCIRASSLPDMTYKILADGVEIYEETNLPPVDFDTPFFVWDNGREFEKELKVILSNTSLSSQIVDIGFLGVEIEYAN